MHRDSIVGTSFLPNPDDATCFAMAPQWLLCTSVHQFAAARNQCCCIAVTSLMASVRALPRGWPGSGRAGFRQHRVPEPEPMMRSCCCTTPRDMRRERTPFVRCRGWPGSGSVEFQGVTARYRPGLPPVLSDLTFTVEVCRSCFWEPHC